MFESLVEVLPQEIIKKDALDLVTSLGNQERLTSIGDMSQPLASRVVSAKLMKSIALRVDAKTLTSKIIPKTKALC